MKKSKKILILPHKKLDIFYIYGKHAVLAALNNPLRKKHKLYISSKNNEVVKKYSDNLQIKVISSDEFDSILPAHSLHQGFALEVAPLQDQSLEKLIPDASSLIIVLDQVTDPHNVGAILRSAAAFGATAVINSFHNSPAENAIIAKVACGALDMVPYIRVTNISTTMEFLKKNNFWCFGLDSHTNEYFPENLPDKTCIVMGSEEKGIRRLVRENCDALYKIKISSNMESLNVSTAAAIAMSNYYSKLKI